MRASGRGLCRWPERHGEWVSVLNPLTGRHFSRFQHADGRTEDVAVWRPDVREERADDTKCGPSARHYERTWWGRLLLLPEATP